MELARSSKIDKTIERVNTIYDYINLYILQTGDKAVTRDKLDDAFGLTNSNWLGYDNKIITFSINNNIVTFKNIIDKNTISESLKRLNQDNYSRRIAVIGSSLAACLAGYKPKNKPIRMCAKCRGRENQALLHRFQIINGKINRFKK